MPSPLRGKNSPFGHGAVRRTRGIRRIHHSLSITAGGAHGLVASGAGQRSVTLRSPTSSEELLWRRELGAQRPNCGNAELSFTIEDIDIIFHVKWSS
ncbi:unnamed protein product [Pleuronectes platessa]|uniref:Uncharacterized protein n=1 Tax=Pleuronectes platessa TaxID=8262 RepID=A0A9N7Z9W8_PLEPL|nr:unnamed protein product [Pleuronectes platessa]